MQWSAQLFARLWGFFSLADRQPLDVQSFTRYFLPALLCYYATAVFVLLPHTFAIRLAIFPMTLCSAVRAIHSLDFSFKNDEFSYLNQGLVLFMMTMVFRTCIWTFRSEPYRRHKEGNNHAATTTNSIASDAFDLLFNLRGIGWSWSQGLCIPKETRDVTSTRSFLLSTFHWFLQSFIAFDFCHYAVQWFSPTTFGSPKGGTIYDPTLSHRPSERYARSTMITLLGGLTIHLAIDAQYNVATLFAIVVFRQSPSQWPPISNRPYFATSLNQFWTVRWHQGFRQIFIRCGGEPLTCLTGKAGGVVGAFLISGLLHDVGCWGMGRGTDVKKISGFFIMNAVGVILEHAYKSRTNRRVGGLLGWTWTFAWLLGWGSMLIDAWMIRGLAGSTFLPPHLRPASFVLGPLSR